MYLDINPATHVSRHQKGGDCVKKLLIGFLTLALALSMSTAALAAIDDDFTAGADPSFGDVLQEGEGDLGATIESVMQWIFGFLGVIAVLVILYGGFMWMTAGGNDDKVKKAKQILISGIIGLVIVLSAYAIATFVFSEIQDNLLTS